MTNPNVFVFGKPGRGKSATVKVFCLRMMDFGYRVLILGDTKDEYEALCRALGVEPFAIGHGLAGPDQPARARPARHTAGRELDRQRGAAARGDHLRPLAGAAPRAGRLAEDRRPAGAVRPVR